MMNQFLVVHDYGYPALYVKLEAGVAGNSAGHYMFVLMLEGVWLG